MRAFFLLAIFVPLFSFAETECRPSAGSCELYLCKEREMSCGEKGYWLNYGLSFCEKFLRNEHSFSPACRSWLPKVRLCLQNQVQELNDVGSCNELRRRALHGHIDCYLHTGFCELSGRDQFQVLWELRSALGEVQTWQESYLLAQACSSARAP
ncbi:MAG TPA: hypothetical protein PL182_05710 [Pseudobdellovibrionaceae bacterium]|nr:hypothetical protein [Pseudobdellovibrionaceae bacterium]